MQSDPLLDPVLDLFRRVETRAPVIANAWHLELSSHSGTAGTNGHYEHAIRDSWSMESFGFPTGSVTGALPFFCHIC